jgi:hypothetical protein
MRRLVSVLVIATVLLPSLFAQTPQPPTNQTTQEQNSKSKCSDSGTYVNSQGQTVKRPAENSP